MLQSYYVYSLVESYVSRYVRLILYYVLTIIVLRKLLSVISNAIRFNIAAPPPHIQ